MWTQQQLPGAKVVKAFNTWPFYAIKYQGLKIKPGDPEQPAVPIAGDDASAVKIAEQLVIDAGLPVVVVPGGLAKSALFDTDTPIGPNSFAKVADVRSHLEL